MRWLARMALRNALRRRWQSLVVVAGLMMGTAIIAGSLAAGDSLTFGIRQGAYDGLGPADLFLQVEGQLHFPRILYDDLLADSAVTAETVALAPILYEEAALSNPRTRQGEPLVSLIGIDPDANRAFGAFTGLDGRALDGSELGPREMYLVEDVAAKLDVREGETVQLFFAEAITPLVPEPFLFNGRLSASAGLCPVQPLCTFATPPTDASRFTFEVDEGAVSITSLLAWQGATAQVNDLDQLLRAPDGGVFTNVKGTPGAPDNPSVLNVSAPLAPGTWTLEVGAKAAVDQPFDAVVLVFYEEYDLAALRDFAEQAEQFGFEVPEPGDLAPARAENVTVRAIVKEEGFGDFLLGQNAFMLETAVAEMYGVDGKVNLILASGDETRLLDVLPRAVNASAAANPEAAGLSSVKVVPVKSRWLDAADEAGSLFKEFLTTIGSFTVIAGLMLIVNIFVMLAEERKSELGMARAVGLKRGQLIRLFAAEGVLYALAASVFGVFLGLGIAYALIWGLNGIFGQADAEVGILHIPYHVEPASLGYAFAAGFLLTVLTVAVASWRVSRLNVVRAIRRIETPPRRASNATTWVGALIFLAGSIATVYGFTQDQFVMKAIAPEIALFGGALLATRFIARRIVFPTAGAAIALYAGWSIFRLGNPEGLINRIMGPVRGVVIVLAVVLILLYLPQVVRWTSRALLRIRPLVPAVRPGVAYPLEKKTRTGLTVTMFALVVLVVVAFSVFGETFTPDLTAQSGGYEVEGDATVPVGDLRAWLAANPPPDGADPLASVTRYDELRYAMAFGGDLLRFDGDEPNYQGPPVDQIYTYDEAFARANAFDFESLDPAYATATDAYLAVLANPALVIVSSLYNFDETGQPGAHAVGDTLTMQTPRGALDLRIIGFQRQFWLGGVFVHPDVLDANFQRIRGEYLFDVEDGADAAVVAREIEAAFQGAGMNAESVEEVSRQYAEQSRRFMSLFQLFLAFGLVVGIASLGIVTARGVLERRQEIGMLRAVGYRQRDVLRMLYVEIFLTTTLGVVIGSVIGLIVSYGVVVSTPGLDALGVEFRVPWLDLLRMLVLIYVAVFLATFVPARKGARTAPAEAVRYLD